MVSNVEIIENPKESIDRAYDISLSAREKLLVVFPTFNAFRRNAITKEAWNIAHDPEYKREKIHALSLAKECYSMKLDLLTNATVVDDVMRFVSDHSNKRMITKEENRSKES